MNKEKQNNTTINSVDEKSNNSDLSSSNEKTTKMKNSLIESTLLRCFQKYIKKFFKKMNIFFSKLSILSQFLFILIPFSLFLLIILLLIHYHAFEKVLKFDFYYTLKEEYLEPIISDLDDIHFEIGSLEIKSTYEDIEYLFFFKIYFRELITMGLLNEAPNDKIFPNISNISQSLYESLDLYQKEIKMNSHYTIPKSDSFKYIDNRTDSFSEIAKLYYYMFPSIAFEFYLREIYINQSFLIAYEYDSDKKIVDNNYLYFAFPVFENESANSKNFKVENSYIWPKISNEKVLHGEKYNNSFYKENWFIKQDYDFRMNSNKKYNIDFSIAHYNYNYYGKLNKSNIISVQNYETSNGKNYIINFIFFINQRSIKEESFDYSTFLVYNNSIYIKEKERYSDNQTYLIFKSNILELTLSDILFKYSHFGIYDKDYNFFKDGASFDGFDMEKLGEPLKYYNTIKNFNIDLRLFSAIYFYSFLFIKAKNNLTINEKTEMAQFDFENNGNLTYNICSEFNFSSYQEYLNNENIDCWNVQNLLYYSEKEIPYDKSLHYYINMPYCICLPLYCLKDNDKNYDPNLKEYTNSIVLPDRCQNYFKYFQNNNEEELKVKKTLIDFSEKINIFSNKLKEKLEDEFYIFKYMKFSHIPDIYILIINFVDNSILKSLLSKFIDNITLFQFYFYNIIFCSFTIIIIMTTYILIHNIKKLSEVIFEYQKKHEYYLYQSSLYSNNNLDINNEIGHEKNNLINKEDNIFNSSDNKPLLPEKNEYLENYSRSHENPLLDDLFKIFYKYYNISIDDLVKKYFKSEKYKSYKVKINLMEEKNELFKLLSILSLYAPIFKLNVSMDYNFYIKSKLNQNFVKSIKKNGFAQPGQIALTQGVIYELLSTENIEDYGFLTNINFKYVTNINLKTKNYNSIKKSIFRYEDSIEKENEDNKYNYNKIIIKEDNNIITKIMYKERNCLLDELENNFENDDFLKRDKLDAAFNFFLINVYYKYLKKILPTSESIQQQENFE